MKFSVTLCLLTLTILPGSASASWFEYCDLTGSVEQAQLIPGNRARTYQLDVRISSASRSKVDGDQSYVDCHEHVGQVLTISLQLPRKVGHPSLGDKIFFSRSAVDVVGPDGIDRTNIQVRLLEYTRVEPPQPEG